MKAIEHQLKFFLIVYCPAGLIAAHFNDEEAGGLSDRGKSTENLCEQICNHTPTSWSCCCRLLCQSNVNQNTNVAAEFCKVRKRTSGLAVSIYAHTYSVHVVV